MAPSGVLTGKQRWGTTFRAGSGRTGQLESWCPRGVVAFVSVSGDQLLQLYYDHCDQMSSVSS